MKGRISANAAVFLCAVLLIFAVLLLRACLASAPNAANGGQVNIYIDGQLKETLALPTEGETQYRVETDGSYNLLVLDSGGVRMTQSDCPHGDCVAQGYVSFDTMKTRPLGGWIVCLPHRVSVELVKHE